MKAKDKWDPEHELKAFNDSKKSALDSFEELAEGAREIERKEPGYFAKLGMKILDNIQIKVIIFLY